MIVSSTLFRLRDVLERRCIEDPPGQSGASNLHRQVKCNAKVIDRDFGLRKRVSALDMNCKPARCME